MAKSHVGHDAHLKERVVLHTGAIIGGHSVIGRYTYMGLNCSTHPYAILGDYCIVGANGVYKGYSTDGIVWAGVPARALKVNTVGFERHATPEEAVVLKIRAEEFIRTLKKEN
jgi:UDP-N-acetylglucosamine acyltransferase